MRSRIANTATLVVLALAACSSTPPPVSLDGRWPAKGNNYEEVTDAWTREAKLIASFEDGFDKILDVSATFHSPQWRVAYIDFRSKRELLPSNKKAQLLAEHRMLDEKYYEVMLLVQTHDFRGNDLQKGKRSVWRLALVDAKGNEVEPTEIKSVRTPRDFMRPYYPNLVASHEMYLVRFPKEALDVYSSGADKFSLKVASARGGVELIWKAR